MDPADAAAVESVVSLVDEIMDTVYLYNLTREVRDDQATLGFVSTHEFGCISAARRMHIMAKS